MKARGLVSAFRTLVASLLVLAILVLVAYFVLCTRVGTLAKAKDSQRVVLVGVIKQTYPADGGDTSVYELADTTGDVFVLSRRGAPSPRAVAVVVGTVRRTDSGRAIVFEQTRADPF